MAGHSAYCTHTETFGRKPCDCYIGKRLPFLTAKNNWKGVGAAAWLAGRTCDERYPTEYVRGYAEAAGIPYIEIWKVPTRGRLLYGCDCSFCMAGVEEPDVYEAQCGQHHSRGGNAAQAAARLVLYILALRKLHKPTVVRMDVV